MKNKLFIFSILTIFLLINYFPANAQNIPDFLVNEQTCIDGSEQSHPDIDGDGNGNYVVTWIDQRSGYSFDIYAQIYLSDGTTLGDNFKVTDVNENATQYNPSVAVDPNLNFVITWIDKRNAGEWDIYAQRFSNDGTALGSNFKVSDDQSGEEQEDPAVSIDSSGNFVIVWSDERNGDWDIYAQRYLYDGTPIGNNFKINDDIGTCLQFWPACSCKKNGDFIVSWVDKRYNDDYDIYAQRFFADGSAIGSNVKVNHDGGDARQLRPDISIKDNGDYIIAWEDERNDNWDIYLQRYLSDGSEIGNNFFIEDTTDSDQRNASIENDLPGNFVVSWQDSRIDYLEVYAQRFSVEAIPIGSSFIVSTDTGCLYQYQFYSEITVDNFGNFTICWEDHRYGNNGDIFAQSYLNDGTTIGDNFIVNDDIGSENQYTPSIAKDSSDNFIIAWVDIRDDCEDIYAQRFSNDGTALGSNFKVNDDTIGLFIHYSPSIATDAEGNFVITWTDYRSGFCCDIYAQRYSNEGTPLGSNFIVNNSGACMHHNSRVVCKKNGDFIITWGDAEDGGKLREPFHQQQDRIILEPEFSKEKKGTEPDIYAQQYLSDGTPFGENFKVNDDVEYTYQERPDIAVDGNGNFIIAWEDQRNEIWDIYYQRYLSDGTPIGSNVKVEDSIVSEIHWGASVSADEFGNFVIAWRDHRNNKFDIFAQRFLHDGTQIGYNFQVNNDTNSSAKTNPAISVNSIGHFIISWSDHSSGDIDIYAQRYISNGMPYGNNYRIPNTANMQQYNQSVILYENMIYSTWQDNRGGQTGFDIWANVMSWGNFEQEISLNEGYQFMSSNIIANEPDMKIVINDILNENLSFVRNSLGASLQKIGPNWVNGIGDWIVSEGYLVKMIAADSFSINGLIVDPSIPIPVETGFQFVSYFPENPMDALLAFETIMDDNLDYIRNSQGQTLRKIGSIWVNGIGDCQPSEGYLVKMFAEGEIIYPASAKTSCKTTLNPTYFSFEGGNPAEAVYTIYVAGLNIGDEVAAYDGEKMTGAMKINSQNALENELPVFSTLINEQGYEEGNPITFKVWSENDIVPADFIMEAIYDSYVSDVYPDEDGKYSIVNITKGANVIENTNNTISIFPNPSEGIFNISIEGVSGKINIKVFDVHGNDYRFFEIEGTNNIITKKLDLKELAAGIYFIHFSGKDFSKVKKIVIQ